MTQAFAIEYTAQLTALLTMLATAGVRPYRWTPEPITSLDDLWIPLRPTMRAFRIPQASQRFIERMCRQDAASGTLAVRWHWPNARWSCLLIPTGYLVAHIIGYGEHAACHAFTRWHIDAQMAFMHHGTYNPATNHEPDPGHELDALELKENLRAKFDECFPGFTQLPRYRLIRDDDGRVTAVEPISPTEEEEDDDAIY